MKKGLFLPATDVAERIRRQEISSRELAEATLARIDAINPSINAIVELPRRAEWARQDHPQFVSSLEPP
jgi:Asp-tRNA(Asn)/Glu-tRNA(Gln) amidotransferase A subunit family amidase